MDNQQDFNQIFYKALEYSRDRDVDKMKKNNGLLIYIAIHVLFLVWGVMLAFKSQPPHNRVVHITLAIVFGPAYVLAYYLNTF